MENKTKQRKGNYLNEKYGILTSDNVLLFLALHLIVVYMKLLHDLSPQKFSQPLEWVTAAFFAVSYAFATIYILRQDVPRILKVSFGLLDGAAIFLWYFRDIEGKSFSVYGAVLFALFTVIITLSLGFLKYNTNKKKTTEEIEEEKQNLLKEFEEYKAKTIAETERLKTQITNFNSDTNYLKLGFAHYMKSTFRKTKESKKREIADRFQLFIDRNNGKPNELSEFALNNFESIFNK